MGACANTGRLIQIVVCPLVSHDWTTGQGVILVKLVSVRKQGLEQVVQRPPRASVEQNSGIWRKNGRTGLRSILRYLVRYIATEGAVP